MGVYIKGMDMPTNCADCKVRIATGCCGNLPHNMRMPNCPLAEVPKHGELIDRTVAVQMVDKLVPFYSGDLMKVAACAVLNANDLVPTVINAED